MMMMTMMKTNNTNNTNNKYPTTIKRTTRTTTRTRTNALPLFIPVQSIFVRNDEKDDDEDDLIKNPTFKQIEQTCSGWQIGHERGGDEEEHLLRTFRARDKKIAKRILETMQASLMVEDERGCRIRRESQELYYLCCDGVRIRMNEGKLSVLCEIPIEANISLGQFKRKCIMIEKIVEEQNKLAL